MPDSISQLVGLLKSDTSTILRDGHKEVFLARAPGRLDIMGAASQYAGGLACQLPLDAATAVAVQRRDDRNLVLKTYNAFSGRDSVVAFSLDEFYGTASLLPQQAQQQLFTGGRNWAAHIAGAFPTLGKHKKLTRRTLGANIACFSNIPPHAAAASSAALECATLWALTAAYHLILDPMEISLLAQKVENQLVGTLSGVVEPATSVLGRRDQLLLLQCQPHDIAGFAAVPTGYAFAGISCGEPGDADVGRKLRVASFMAQKVVTRFFLDMGIKKDPTRGYLANVTPESFQRYFHTLLPESLTGEKFLHDYEAIDDRLTTVAAAATYDLRAAAEFHIAENARSHAFVMHLRDMLKLVADPQLTHEHAVAAGKLMLESHAGARRVGLGGHEADILVELAKQRGPARGIFGARAAAGGHGVSVLAAQGALAELGAIADEFRQKTGHGGLLLTGSSNGAAEAAPVRMPLTDLVP